MLVSNTTLEIWGAPTHVRVPFVQGPFVQVDICLARDLSGQDRCQGKGLIGMLPLYDHSKPTNIQC